MHKTAYLGSLLLITILTLGSFYFPNSAAMWLASSAPAMIVARLIIGVLIVGLLASRPPRSLVFRAVLGAAAVSLAGWGLVNAWNGSITVIDSLLFLHAGISFALAAIEANPRQIFVEDRNGRAKRVAVRTA